MFEQPEGFESRSGNLTITIGAKGQAVFNNAWIAEGYISDEYTTWISNSFNVKQEQWAIQFVHETPDNKVSKEDQAKAGVISFSTKGVDSPKVGITNVFKIALGQPHLLPESGNRMRWSESNTNLEDFASVDPDKKVVILNCKGKEQEPLASALNSAGREKKIELLVNLALNDKERWSEEIQKDKLWTNDDECPYRKDFEERLRFMKSSIRDLEKLEQEEDG